METAVLPVTPEFTAEPDPEPIRDEEPPKRRRGRPPRDQQGPVDATPRKPRRSRGASLEAATAASLFKLNLWFAIGCQFAPGLDPRKDPLDGLEITAIAASLVEQAKGSVRLTKMLEAFNAVAGSDNIVLLVIIIAGRRAARHGILPEFVDDMGAAALGDEKVLSRMAADAMGQNGQANMDIGTAMGAMFGGTPEPPKPEVPVDG